MAGTAIGVDIGGTHLRAARVEAGGTIAARAKTASSADPVQVLQRVESLIEELFDDTVSGIGIGVPGRVDFSARKVLSGGHVDLSDVPLAERLEARFGRPVALDNDAGMALTAEARIGAAKGARSAVLLTIGTGIGGAILENGRVVRGRATAGQLGHLVVDFNGAPCLCGGRGCVELYSSGTALRRHLTDAGFAQTVSAADLLAARAGGDAAATAVLRAWAAPLKAAIAGLTAALDPEIVILGGGLGASAFAALSGLEAPPSWYRTRIASAALGDDAGVIGAALAALPNTAAKRLVLVNGVPASGKSSVALALSGATGWPVLSLDTIKDPFLREIEGVDRPFNRKLGRASFAAMVALVRDAPLGSTFILDAWFGFQPRDWVEGVLRSSGATILAELWCHADPGLVGVRYRARAAQRPPGHPGADYAPELVALAARAEPSRFGPVLEIDTATPADITALRQWLERQGS